MKKNLNEFCENEKRILDLEYEFITDFIALRKSLNLTQQQLADETNVIRTTIARIESLITSPQINTVLKILEPLGYTIKIVPTENSSK